MIKVHIKVICHGDTALLSPPWRILCWKPFPVSDLRQTEQQNLFKRQLIKPLGWQGLTLGWLPVLFKSYLEFWEVKAVFVWHFDVSEKVLCLSCSYCNKFDDYLWPMLLLFPLLDGFNLWLEVTSWFLSFFQVDGALRISHRRSNQLQIQNKVHLAHWGLVSTFITHYVLLKQSAHNLI